MFLRQIFDPALAQYAYLVGCQRTGEAILIDPERDIDRYLAIAAENDLHITAVAETHIHADFLSGARELLETREGVTAYLSDEGGPDWDYLWARGRSDVRLLKDRDQFDIGNIRITALHTPGHTPEHMSFSIEDRGGGADLPMAIATGDFVFVGDVGRPDLLESAAGIAGMQEPSARALHRSLLEFAKLPDFIQILPAHGAGSACGKSLGAVPTSTVGYERRFNSAIRSAIDGGEEAFVASILEGQPEPPLYFARMKRDNKIGPALLRGLPRPERIDAAALPALLGKDKSAFLDTRRDRPAFMRAHLRGALFTPLGNRFNTVAGSFVPEGETIYLLLEREDDLDEAVRQLIRIGLDDIAGYALLDEIFACDACREHLRSIEAVAPARLDALLERHPDAVVLDVRTAAEHAEARRPEALNLAYTRLLSHMDELPAGPKHVVHCKGGTRATFAASLLERHGRDTVIVDGPVPGMKAPAREHAGEQEVGGRR